MKYYLDTEFNGFNGELISLALVREDGESLYLVNENINDMAFHPWVRDNVLPVINDSPCLPIMGTLKTFPYYLANFFKGDANPVIITDWPDDIKYMCQSVITKPGEMVAIPQLSFHMVRVDAYPTNLEGAIQHNAMWDAMALRDLLN
jgi:hypothetical protein